MNGAKKKNKVQGNMRYCDYINEEMYVEKVNLRSIAMEFGTPCYVYSKSALVDGLNQYREAFGSQPHLICFATKANSNLTILNLLAKMGSGFDIVSGGELIRVLRAGGNPSKIVFSGIGKSEKEIQLGIDNNIYCFNVESISELKRIEKISRDSSKKTNISFRVNPDVDARTHPYISTGLKENKFGIPWHQVTEVYKLANASKYLNVIGIDCHIGSQMTDVKPFVDAARKVVALSEKLSLEGIPVEHLDFGGGLGISYSDEETPSIQDWIKELLDVIGNKRKKVLVEPGRSIVGPAGLLLTKVEYKKNGSDKDFLIVDAAMNDLARPALYGSYHKIKELIKPTEEAKRPYDVVGPICETGDFLGKNRLLRIEEGEFLAIMDAGAYGMSMASNYNSRARSPEVLVDGDKVTQIRERENIEELSNNEPTPG